MKNTRQRAAILRVLDESAEPLSAEEVHSRLHGEEPSLALSTVYRNLERFCSENLLHRDTFGDGVVRYSPARRHGHYLICTGCDARVRIDGCPGGRTGTRHRIFHREPQPDALRKMPALYGTRKAS